MSKVCSFCGLVFEPEHNAEKYCSDKCRSKARSRQLAINTKKYKASDKAKAKVIERKSNLAKDNMIYKLKHNASYTPMQKQTIMQAFGITEADLID